MAGGGAQPQTRAEEVGVADAGVGEGGVICTDVGDVLCCGGVGGSSIWFGDLGYVPANCKDTGRIPPQVGPKTDRVETEEVT